MISSYIEIFVSVAYSCFGRHTACFLCTRVNCNGTGCIRDCDWIMFWSVYKQIGVYVRAYTAKAGLGVLSECFHGWFLSVGFLHVYFDYDWSWPPYSPDLNCLFSYISLKDTVHRNHIQFNNWSNKFQQLWSELMNAQWLRYCSISRED